MQELIQHNEGGDIVDARLLHNFLESKQRFADWIKARIANYEFNEGADFVITLGRSEANRATTEYALTLDMAKELAMVEGNAKGKQARRYFIEYEKRGKQAVKPDALAESQDDLILMLAQRNADNSRRLRALEAERAADQQRLGAVEQQVSEVAAKLTTVPTDFFTIAGWASLQKLSIPTSRANELGRKAAAMSKAQGVEIGKVPDQRYGAVNAYHVSILRQILPPPPGTSLTMVVIPKPPQPPVLQARQAVPR